MKDLISLFFLHFVLGGILGWFSTETQPFILGIIALLVFFYVLSLSLTSQNKSILFFGFFWGFSFVQNFWMKDLKVPAGSYFLDAFGLVLALFFSLWIAIQFIVAIRAASNLKGVKKILGFVGLWVLIEYHRSWFLCGYNFYTLSSFLEKLGCVDKVFAFTGVFGATFLLLLAALPPFFFPKKRGSYLGMFLILFILTIPQFKKELAQIKVGVVRTQRDPWANNDKIYQQKYLDWLQSVNDLDVLVFSETSFPGKYFFCYPEGLTMEELLDCYKLEAAIVNLSFQKNIDVIVGHIYPGTNEKFLNVATLVHKGEIVGRYEKMRLMSVMENSWDFLPDSFKSILDTGNFIPGDKKNLLKGKYLYGVNICYDDYFGSDSSAFSKKGADLIISMHNDIWIENDCFKYNHFRQSLLRSMETGLPTVRSSNGGLCGYALPDGECNFFSPDEGLMVFQIPIFKNLTIYPYLQDRFFLLLAFGVLIVAFRNRDEKNCIMNPRRD